MNRGIEPRFLFMMSIRRLVRTAVCTTAGLTASSLIGFTGAAVAQAPAAKLEVERGHCQTVRLVARNAPLSEVLERLATTLDFQLHDEVRPKRPVTANLSGPAAEVVAKLLSSHERFMVSHAPNHRCAGQRRIAQIWLLSGGEERMVLGSHATPAVPSAPASKAAPEKALPKAVPVTITATPDQLRRYEEQARQRKQDYDAYVNKHGEPPPGEEEEAARP